MYKIPVSDPPITDAFHVGLPSARKRNKRMNHDAAMITLAI